MKSTKSNWHFFIKGIIKLIDALVLILTLGLFSTNLEYRYVKYVMFKKNRLSEQEFESWLKENCKPDEEGLFYYKNIPYYKNTLKRIWAKESMNLPNS